MTEANNLRGVEAKFRFLSCLAAIAFTYTVAVLAYYRHVGFSVLQSDVSGYARWSHDLLHNSVHFHLPAYPALIAAIRQLTFGLLPDQLLMPLICLILWIVGTGLAWSIAERLVPDSGRIAAVGYGFFPFVGVAFVPYPLADVPACTTVLAVLWSILRSDWRLAAAAAGTAILINKGVWAPTGILMIAAVATRRIPWYAMVAAGLPFLAYYLSIAVAKEDVIWIIRPHLEIHLTPKTGHPVFDSILGTLDRPGLAAKFKGGILCCTTLVALSTSIRLFRRREWLLLASILHVLVYAAFINSVEAWSIVRFAKFLAIPAAMAIAASPRAARIAGNPWVLGTTTIGLLASQALWNETIRRFFTP